MPNKICPAHLSIDQSVCYARAADRAVGLWLLICAALVFVMIGIGGITRLTESGLSMVEWRPLIGILPPFSASEWQRIFDLYHQTSEYQMRNFGMSLSEFQKIFWWEYIHRLWGRGIGLAFVIPLMIFSYRRRLRSWQIPHFLLLLGLGGFQGWLGWWMVQSGFVNRTDVSQYRLVAHLAMALLILGYLVRLGMMIWQGRSSNNITNIVNPYEKSLKISPPFSISLLVWGLVALVGLTLLSGGFVAGLDGGLIYNSFPTMNGNWVPEDYWGRSSIWLNGFENPAAAQFHHRIFALVTLVMICVAAWWLKRHSVKTSQSLRQIIYLAAGIAILQTVLGITVVIMQVPLMIGALHQIGGLFLLLTLLIATDRVACGR